MMFTQKEVEGTLLRTNYIDFAKSENFQYLIYGWFLTASAKRGMRRCVRKEGIIPSFIMKMRHRRRPFTNSKDPVALKHELWRFSQKLRNSACDFKRSKFDLCQQHAALAEGCFIKYIFVENRKYSPFLQYSLKNLVKRSLIQTNLGF